MMFQATLQDRAAIEAFLRTRPHQSMFPSANLAEHGMQGGHNHAMRFWLNTDGDAVTDALGVTEGGMVLPLLPSADYAAAADVLTDLPVIGLVGPAKDVRGLEACGFAQLPHRMDEDEPQFLLELGQLCIPEGPGELHPMETVPSALIKSWIRDYDLNTLHADPIGINAQVDATYQSRLVKGTHKVLMEGETPLAITGFNARLPDIVQIGGVYTPPDLRGRGYARRAVALHLAEAAAQGVRTATLFAASAPAARAYRAIGFKPVGTWSILLFEGPQRRGI